MTHYVENKYIHQMLIISRTAIIIALKILRHALWNSLWPSIFEKLVT